MKSRYAIFMAALLLILMLSGTASALTARSGGTVVIDDVIEDDVYIAGGNVLISGTVVGDVVIAGGRVEISGNITEDLTVAAGEVVITGSVGDDIRVAAGNLTFNGDVESDLALFTGDTVIGREALIGGVLAFSAGQMEMLGNVTWDLTGSAGTMVLGGHVGGNAELQSGSLVMLPDARIEGDLRYTAPERIEVPEGTVGGEVYYNMMSDRSREVGVIVVLWWIASYLALVVIGLVALAIWPDRMQRLARRTSENPGTAFLTGLLAVIAAFVISVLLMLTIIGIPFGLIILILTIILLYVVRIITGFWLGKWMFAKMGRTQRPWVELVFGLFVLLLVSAIPIIGWLVNLVATLIPVGNLAEEIRRRL
jgi:cytoskeletal protein CcmA (bactofilin family)